MRGFFFMQKLSTPLSQQSPSKNWGPVKPPLFENWVGGSPSPPPLSPRKQKGGGGVHKMMVNEVILFENFLLPSLNISTSFDYFTSLRCRFICTSSLLKMNLPNNNITFILHIYNCHSLFYKSFFLNMGFISLISLTKTFQDS